MTEVSMTPEILQSLRESIASAIHCALPGRVVSFDASTQTADIQPMVRRRGEDGIVYTMPVLNQVPVFLPAGSGFTVSPGDACLLIFADCCIDGWYETGEASLPMSGRAHDLSDAFAFVGFRSGGGS